MKRLEETLRSSKTAAGGFLGSDRRPLEEIIEADAAELARLGYTTHDIAGRMRHISSVAECGLGSWVEVDGTIEATVTDTRGKLPCPWSHPGTFLKTVVTAKNLRTGKTIRWSLLGIHMIEEHSFFEGRGATFRLDPKELVNVLF